MLNFEGYLADLFLCQLVILRLNSLGQRWALLCGPGASASRAAAGSRLAAAWPLQAAVDH
jgi:hypothetical protein